MSTKIGHFEILSELAKSATGAVYKANDLQNSQTVALKTILLSAFGPYAAELEKCLQEEAETTKILSHPNLAPVYGAGEIDHQFCAAMEYIQGNSIATMLARKEGFSIWDLLDIGRQVCAGLDHAHSHKIFHFSLEPAKVICGWDGTVRVLGFGVSSVGRFMAEMPGVPPILHYLSPEQVRGEAIDGRSNLFSLGAMFYEMVTDRKAFDAEDPATLCQSIVEITPPPPVQLNSKIHPQLSDLIMKAIAKNPAERYQNGRELLDDLEQCKESKPQGAKAPAAPAKTVAAPEQKAAPQAPPAERITAPPAASVAEAATARKAAAAGAGSGAATAPAVASANKPAPARVPSAPAKAPVPAPAPSLTMSCLDAPVVEKPEAERPSPKITVDPMMAEAASGQAAARSFSEMTELPPLKEVYVAPAPPPAEDAFEPEPPPSPRHRPDAEKPKLQPRQVAQNAIKEIKGVPPRLMIYSIAGAAVLILVIAIALMVHINSLNSEDSGRSAAGEAAVQPAPTTQPAHSPASRATAPAAEVPAATAPARAVARGVARKKSATPPPVAPAVLPGQMAIDSAPQGAQVQIDGTSDPSWITPFTLSGLSAGQHSVTVSKSGYSSDTRTVDVVSGSKSFVVTHLAALMATLAVSSSPAGANVYIDGRDTGKLTPAQVPVDKGQHVVLVRKSGFLDETSNSQFTLGQTVSFSPVLRSLGNVDDIRTVGKMKKIFGGKDAQGMASISVKTQPKGAQVAVNQHMLDKSSPVDFVLNPGNYVVDITLTGYAPIHKIITVDKGGKAVVDEILKHE